MADRISKHRSTVSQRTKTIFNMAVNKVSKNTTNCSTKQHKNIETSYVRMCQPSLPELKIMNVVNSLYAKPFSLTSSVFNTFCETQTTYCSYHKPTLENIISKLNESSSEEKNIDKKKETVSSVLDNEALPNSPNSTFDLICHELMPLENLSYCQNLEQNIECSIKEKTRENIISPLNEQLDFDSDDSVRDKDYHPSDTSDSEDDFQDLTQNIKKSQSQVSNKKKIPKTYGSRKSQTTLKVRAILPNFVSDLKNKQPPTRRHSTGFSQSETTVSAPPLCRKRRKTIDICDYEIPVNVTSAVTCSSAIQNFSLELLPESSQKRKKYSTSVTQRKLEAINRRKLEHGVKMGCPDNCLKKCATRMSQEERLEINKKYWEMSWSAQHSFVEESTSVAIPKRKTTTELKRRPRRVFTLKKVDGTRVEVCKIFFLTTLGYLKTNDRILHYDIKDISVDRRGKHQKTPLYDRDLLTQHIESFNPTEHHYRREHAPLRRYLPSDINIVNMHNDYCEKYPEKKVSYELYRQHLKTMNISFTRLGNEECEVCETYNLHKKETSHDAKQQIVADCTKCVEWAQHHEKYKKARQLYSKQKEIPRNNAHIYYSADLEKVIMLPRMETFKSVIFCKRLVAFNQTFAPIGKITNEFKPLAVLWNDSVAGRRQEDIMTSFYHFLLRHRDVAHINLWLDNCSSQNKNWLLYSLFVYMINSDMIGAESLTLFYFEPGHTFMSCDQVHHQVELAMKKKGKLYDFMDFVDSVESINQTKVTVKPMTATDFINVPNYVSDRRIQTSNPRAYLKDMCQVSFNRKNYDLQYKNNFDDQFMTLRFMNDKFIKNPSIMKIQHRSAPKGIDLERKTEILNKISNIIPVHKQVFWKNLPTTINETASTSGTSNKTSRLSNCKTK